ncbi:hypothetical protein [Nonomuraea sp. NPDC049784]|uniref:hypothetical protein n=1 Tax=Nonomuraea sp. NPDC049784 TaxID=3154361 RepID=UPI0033CA8700
MIETNGLTDDLVLLAVRRDGGKRPEPPATWALASDTGLGPLLEAKARARLHERGYDSDMSHYTLYAVDQRDYQQADADRLRNGNRDADIVHTAFGVSARTIIAVRQAAGRWRDSLTAS